MKAVVVYDTMWGSTGKMALAVADGLCHGGAAPVVLPANAASNIYDGGLGEDAVNDSPHTLLFVPVISSEKVVAVLLLISPTDVETSTDSSPSVSVRQEDDDSGFPAWALVLIAVGVPVLALAGRETWRRWPSIRGAR